MPNKLTKAYPLRHHWEGTFDLSMDTAAKRSTYISLLAADQGLVNPEDVQVNPSNDNFQSTTSHTCFPMSVVNKVRVRLMMSIPPNSDSFIQNFPTAAESALTVVNGGMMNSVLYKTCLIHGAFDVWDQVDEISTSTVADVLRLQKEASNANQIHPIFSGTDLVNATCSDTTIPAGLTTDSDLENVAFVEDTFEDDMQGLSTTTGLLKKVTSGGLRTHILRRDNSFYTKRWYTVPGDVKRMNRWTYCGLLFTVPGTDSQEQFYIGTDVNAASHLRCSYDVYYNEYNDLFDQAS